MDRKSGPGNSGSHAANFCFHAASCHRACAMLPFCDRHVSVPRTDVAPVWTRSFTVSKEPVTLGQHLRKRRFELGLRQADSAVKLGVTCKTLSDWETDRIRPSLTMQPR